MSINSLIKKYHRLCDKYNLKSDDVFHLEITCSQIKENKGLIAKFLDEDCKAVDTSSWKSAPDKNAIVKYQQEGAIILAVYSFETKGGS